MPKFKYTALTFSGKEVKGKVAADNKQAALADLKSKGLFPTVIKEVGFKSGINSLRGKKLSSILKTLNVNIGTPKIPKKELVFFTRKLAILIEAGLPLVRALRTLERQAANKLVKSVIQEITDSVEGGFTFSEALSKHPKSFNYLYINMVRAGESAGALEVILDRLATFMEKTAKIISKVKSAMIYPTVVIVIALLVTGMLMIFIVPKFKEIFNDLLGGASLPKVTEFIIAVSDFLTSKIYYIFIAVLILIIAYKILKKTKKGTYWIDYAKYNVPLFGPIISKTAISRFCRTLGTLLNSGVPVLRGLLIVRDTASNSLVENAVQKVHDAVKEGDTISSPLSSSKIFPEMVISMMEVGEETGNLPKMLVKIADIYEDEVDNAVTGLTSAIEPLLIVFMAIVVGTVVVGMFMPLVKIIQTLSQ